MKKLTALLLTLFCAACSTTQDQGPDWETVQKWSTSTSVNLPPAPPVPQPLAKDHTGREAAQAYKTLQNSYVDLSAGYEQCRVVAQGK